MKNTENQIPHPAIVAALLKGGVRNLKEFGYPSVDEYNILTDRIYGRFFERMLEEHAGNKVEVDYLLSEIKKHTERP